MPSILAIYFILLGIFQGISANNKPGTVLFKFVNNKSRIDNVQIYQNGKEVNIYKAGEDGQAILLPTNEQAILLPTDKQAILLPENLNKYKQFMVDWKKLPEKVKVASDLKKISFRIFFGLGLAEVRDNIQLVPIELRDHSDALLEQLFAGGQAEILVSKDIYNDDIKYVKTKQGDPGHLLFTVDLSQFLLQNVQFKSVQVLQKYTTFFRGKEVEKPCESVKFSGEPITFLIDWKTCPKTINKSEMLKNIKIELEFEFIHPISIHLNKESAGLLEQLFAGGEAKIAVLDGNDAKITYEMDSIGNTMTN